MKITIQTLGGVVVAIVVALTTFASGRERPDLLVPGSDVGLHEVPTRQLEHDCSLIFFDKRRVVLRSASDLVRYTRDQRCTDLATHIDFDRETVIAIELSTGWCGTPLGLEHRLLRDDEQKRYILEVKYQPPAGPCRALSRYDFWVATETIKDGYDVEFDVAATVRENEPDRTGGQPN